MTEQDKNTIQALLNAANTPVPGDEAPDTEPETDAPKNTEEKEAVDVSKEKNTEADKSKEINIEEYVKENATEADDKPATTFSLNKTLGGEIIAKAIQQQIWLVLLITLFLIIYINNRYMCQKQTVEIDKLEKKLTQTRYKATVCTSILTEKSRESNIINMLEEKGDSTLTIPNEPPYRIKAE